MGNSGNPRFHPTLNAWAAQSEDPVLRDAAVWARAQIPTPPPQA
jgi:hypothetical protein